MLLAGKPMLLLPIYLEQRLLADAVQRMGAGLWASFDNGAAAVAVAGFTQISQELGRTQASPLQAARSFAQRYAAFDPTEANERLLCTLEQLINHPIPEILPALRSAFSVSSTS